MYSKKILLFCCGIKKDVYLCNVGRAMKMAFPAPRKDREILSFLFYPYFSQLIFKKIVDIRAHP